MWETRWETYIYPESVEQALELLGEGAGRARVIAGGTDLVLQLQRGERQARTLVDVSRIGELRGIRQEGPYVVVGAAATHAEIAASSIVNEKAAVLAQAANEVGSPELRNTATIGGNVVNAQPAADTALALLALDAEVEIVRLVGHAWVSLSDLYAGAGRSQIDSTAELVRSFRFRAPGGGTGTAYRRLGKCKSIALPVLCAAAVVTVEDDLFGPTAIAMGPVAPRPARATTAEAWLAGQPAEEDVIRQGAALAQQDASPRDSLLRCSRAYREEMVCVLVESVLREAVSAARRSRGRE